MIHNDIYLKKMFLRFRRGTQHKFTSGTQTPDAAGGRAPGTVGV
jgi:hypothetical protein